MPEAEYDSVFDECWRGVASEFFKYEARQSYDETGEEEFLGLFRSGKLAELEDLLAVDVARSESIWTDATRRQIAFLRAHAFVKPLSEYIQFELVAYRVQEKAGERIWMVPMEQLTSVHKSVDLMLFDRRLALLAHYDDNGRLVGGTLTDEEDDIRSFIVLQEQCMNLGLDLATFLTAENAGLL